jgi:hypothetical protein
MDYEEEVENMIFAWIMTLPVEDQQLINHPSDVDVCLNEEAEEEIKEELWHLIKNNVNYTAILIKLRNYLNEVIETQEEEEDEE